MIDLWNFIVGAVCAFILGLCAHSLWLHEKRRHGWSTPFDHEEEESEK